MLDTMENFGYSLDGSSLQIPPTLASINPFVEAD
jgi:hypothetical protein